MENKLKEKKDEQQVKFISSSIQSGANSLSQAMYQVRLKELEMTSLKKRRNNGRMLQDFGLKMKRLKKKQVELEKEIKEKNKEQQVQVISPFVQSCTDSLSQAMSQVSLKYL